MLNRLISVILVIACFTLTAALFRVGNIRKSAAPSDAILPPTSRPTLAEDQALLDRRIDQLSLDEVTLDDLIVRLSDLTKVNICADWPKLTGLGVMPDQKFRLHVHNATLGQALMIAVNNLGGSNAGSLGFSANEGIVVISASESLINTRTECFNIRPLVDELDRATPAGVAPGVSRIVNGVPMVGPEPLETVEQIVKVLMDCIVPDTWRDSGGTIGSIREIRGILVVTQTPENLAIVRRALDRLHESLHTVDFPPITQTLAGVPPSNEEAAPGGQLPSTQLVTEYINIRPLIDELRVGIGSGSVQSDTLDAAWRAEISESITNLLTDTVSPGFGPDKDGKITHVHLLGDILAVTESPANVKAARMALGKLHKASAADGASNGLRPSSKSKP